MKTLLFSISALILVFCFLLYCNNNTKTKNKPTVEIKIDSIDYRVPKFVNSLNLPEMELPAVGHFSSANSLDTLDFDLKDSEEYLFDFCLFAKGDKKKGLNLTTVSEIHIYDEGDLDGDGTTEIGILPGYNTSSCRNYLVYSFKNHKWKQLCNISSHLADREIGIDYVKREGDKLRILSADEDECCQCFGLDTSYIKIKY